MKEKISKPGEYQGYSEAKYDAWKRYSEYVVMRDGVRLAVDYYRPMENGNVVEEPLPVVWLFTPYDWRTVLATGKYANGKEHTPFSEEDVVGQAKLLASHGYIFAVGEVRGTGASFGFRQAVNNDLEAWDGFEICQWLSEQSWCNGKVGSLGYSYSGATQLGMIRKNPPALKAAFIGMSDLDKYDARTRGGIMRAFGVPTEYSYMDDLKNICVGIEGKKADKIIHENAVRQHRFSTQQEKSMMSCPYRDSWCEETDSNIWETLSNTTYLNEINSADTQIYLYGGWRDVFRRDTVLMYKNLKKADKMLFGPWHHLDYRPGFDIALEKLRFFDYWLKGIDNGLMDEPPVYYSMGNTVSGITWDFAEDWPLPDTRYKSLFFAGGKSKTTFSVNDGLLTENAPLDENQNDKYKVRYDIMENQDDEEITIDRDTKGITYTSDILTEDLMVVGHPIVDFWISTTATDGDFFIYLIDVDENGNGCYITDAKLRASMRKQSQPPYDFIGLPWHPCNKEDEHKLIPGKLYRLETDMMPMSHVLKKGHRIRITITCACKGFFFQQENEPPVVTIHRDAIHTSYVKLPVLGTEI